MKAENSEGPVAVQDDKRENEMRSLFKLEEGDGREGTDAYLPMGRKRIPVELKSTTKTSFSTVRDFGPDHIRKWRRHHWVFAVYDDRGDRIQYCLYGSPALMEPWITQMEQYVAPDFEIAKVAPPLLGKAEMRAIVGEKTKYTLDDAKRIHKKQWSAEDYRRHMDLENGYSPDRMLQIIRERCEYLIERGSTLNNPHIPLTYFDGWERITKSHASRLRELVSAALSVR